MSEFNPSPRDRLIIGGQAYEVMPHPFVPTFAFGQEGRKAFVYQLFAEVSGSLYALKKFKLAFRVPELVGVCDALERFARWPGLEVCARQCLHYGRHDDALGQFPDLEYAVLMPWISGSTWYDMVISMRPLSRLEALTFANATAQVLSALEEAGLAHCDIAAPNVIINPNTGSAHLIDVEDLYAPPFKPPAALPAGTDGYAHRTASQGLWGPSADRFAGAVIIAEMATWHVPEIRKEADEEHYFGADEMQTDSPRYRLMRKCLADLDAELADLFDTAWFSSHLDACPRLKNWYEAINRVYRREQLARVVSDWQPIMVPAGMQDAAPRPFVPMSVQTKSEAEAEDDTTSEEAMQEPSVAPVPQPIEVSPPPAPAPRTPIPVAPPVSGGPVIEWRPLIVPAELRDERGGLAATATPLQVEPTSRPALAETRPIIAQDEQPVDRSVGQAESITGSVMAEQILLSPLLKPILDLSHVDGRNRPYLVWSESPGAAYYQLEEANSPDFQVARGFRIKAEETRWHPRWGRSGRLFYRVRAVSEDEQPGPWSDTLSIRIGKS